MLFKRNPVNQKTSSQDVLYTEMKEAMHEYNQALKNYYHHLEHDADSGSAYAQWLAQAVEVHRQRYFKLRMQHEVHFGDVIDYQWKLTKFFKWRKETNIPCLFQQPQDQYTTMCSLESQELILI